MAKLTDVLIGVGATANDKKGDSLRAAFQKVNTAFTDIYTTLGIVDGSGLNLGAFEFNGSVISTTDSTAIVIDQTTTVTSDLTVGGDIVPSVANGGNLGSFDKPFRSLFVSNNTVFLGGVPLSLEPGTNELRVNNVPISQTITYADIPNSPTVPADISDLTDTGNLLGGGGGAGPIQTHLELTNSTVIVQPVRLVEPVTFIRTADGSQTDAIAPGLTIARGSIRSIYNIASEGSYDNSTNTSPQGTEWNSEGWGDLLNLRSRTYTTFYEALGRAIGENIIGAELIMHDTINDRYYKFSFSDWGGNNGGSFAYTRTQIEDPNYFKKADYATANNVDVIEDDSTLQIGITRGNNRGIYNPFTEEGWDEDVSPDGTEWNIDGWDDLTDVETRTYTTFYNAYGGQGIGQNILGSKAVMYVPSIDKYYAIQWLSWTQNAEGGGFSYLRYEIDLDKLNEGIEFADGTVQKTAYIPTNVKLTAPDERRIEEVAGYKSVSVTERILRNLTTTASRNYDGNSVIWFDRTTTTIDEILNDREAAGIIDNTTIEFSLDNTTWYKLGNGELSSGDEKGFVITVLGDTPLTYDQGDTVYFRYVGGGGPVVWWDKDDLPGGSSNFRGAVIDYHAYTSDATIIGTIHIVDDDGDEHITHTEVSSGSSDSENDDLWYVTSEGEIKYRRLDGESSTLKIQWTAKVFYGSETYD